MSRRETDFVERMFAEDVREKKKIANQARYRKRGSKSRRCDLASDKMTHKQWTERCGKIVSCNFNEPISWRDFTELSADTQREYLSGLIHRYGTTASDLARMFGVTARTVTAYCGREDIGIRFSPGKRMSKKDRIAFGEFCGNPDRPQQEIEAAEEETETTKPGAIIDIDKTLPASDMAMTEFTLSFSGSFNREMLCNSLASMLPRGAEIKLDIKCLVLQDSL